VWSAANNDIRLAFTLHLLHNTQSKIRGRDLKTVLNKFWKGASMRKVLFTLTVLSVLSMKTMACDGDPSCPMHSKEMTKAQREEIAECFKSEKTTDECHKLMAKHMGMKGKMDGKHSCSEHGKMHHEEQAGAEKTSEPKK
jgi:hypothetical protein